MAKSKPSTRNAVDSQISKETGSKPEAPIQSISDLKVKVSLKLSKQYREILEAEKRIQLLNDEIESIKKKLKPVSRIDKSRGIEKKIARGDKGFLRASKKTLEKQLFQERDNWTEKLQKFMKLVGEDVSKVRGEHKLFQARSWRYVTRNKPFISRKYAKLLDATKDKSNLLVSLQSELKDRDPKKVTKAVKQFLKDNDKDGFLNAAYHAHESLRADFNNHLKSLVSLWSPKKKGFEFKTVNIKFTINKQGEKK